MAGVSQSQVLNTTVNSEKSNGKKLDLQDWAPTPVIQTNPPVLRVPP